VLPAAYEPICVNQAARTVLLAAMPMLDNGDTALMRRGDLFHSVVIPGARGRGGTAGGCGRGGGPAGGGLTGGWGGGPTNDRGGGPTGSPSGILEGGQGGGPTGGSGPALTLGKAMEK
jgi:hypothetical protein